MQSLRCCAGSGSTDSVARCVRMDPHEPLLDLAEEDEGEAANNKRRSTGEYPFGLALPVFLVCINQLSNVVSSEVTQIQETSGAAPFDSPLFTIWINHTVTGILCLSIALVQSYSEGRTLEQKLLAANYPLRTAVIDGLVLGLLFFVSATEWAFALSADIPVRYCVITP